MTKPQFDSSSLTNLVDADTSALKGYIVLAVVTVFVLIGGAALYTWHVQSIQVTEQAANDALFAAKTAADKIKVADDYPATLTAARALILAGKQDFDAGDFTSSLALNQRVLTNYPDSPLREVAELGEAAAWDETNHSDDALRVYLEVARRRASTPYSPYAYLQAASILQAKHETDSLRTVLEEALGASQSPGGSSAFLQRLMMMRASLPPVPLPIPTTNSAPSTAPTVTSPAPSQAPVSPVPTPKPKP